MFCFELCSFELSHFLNSQLPIMWLIDALILVLSCDFFYLIEKLEGSLFVFIF
jgi:hypothetical protein